MCCWQLTSVRPVHLEQVQVICAQALQALLNTLLYLLRRDSGSCAWPEVLVLIISARHLQPWQRSGMPAATLLQQQPSRCPCHHDGAQQMFGQIMGLPLMLEQRPLA